MITKILSAAQHAVAVFGRRYVYALLLIVAMATTAPAQLGNDNPTGISGAFNGSVTTGGSYDPYTGNVTRSITDISVAGAVGAYPLALTRTLNSRYETGRPIEFGHGGTWTHNYQWRVITAYHRTYDWYWMPTSYLVEYPDGRRVNFFSSSQDSVFRGPAGSGISDRFQQPGSGGGAAYLLLPDGGKIHFEASIDRQQAWDGGPYDITISFQFVGIVDPHGLYTSVTYPGDGSLTITEPAGRQLKLFYSGTVLDRVEEHAWNGAGARRSVKYNYALHGSYTVLANVVYFNDGNLTAVYTYQNSNAGGRPLLSTANDPMYDGPMRVIAYEYAATGIHGQILREKHPNGTHVSTLSTSGSSRTEQRGDGPLRYFDYSAGKLTSWTDFRNQRSYKSVRREWLCLVGHGRARPHHHHTSRRTDWRKPAHHTSRWEDPRLLISRRQSILRPVPG